MRVAQDLLNSVTFISTGAPDELSHQATAFLLDHNSALYLVTAKHVAERLSDLPFYVRFNLASGSSKLLPIDFETSEEPLFQWFPHAEPSVDLAILPFPFDIGSQGVVAVALRSDALVERKNPMADAGCGDMCHVIGLFTPRPGRTRNIAVLHTGHIAAMSDGKELIETDDHGKKLQLEGYLVEASNLSGLSGAPVFVRGGLELNVPIEETGETRTITAPTPELKLLGVWAGSWDRPINQFSTRAPVGIGVVTPAYRLLELLESDAVAKNRREWIRKLNAAKTD
jgi:hypothetical protein